MLCTQLSSNSSTPMLPISAKKVSEKAHDLTVDPIHDLTEDGVGNKIPNKQWFVHLFFGVRPHQLLGIKGQGPYSWYGPWVSSLHGLLPLGGQRFGLCS